MTKARSQKLMLTPKTWNNLDHKVRRTLYQSLDEALTTEKLSVFMAIPVCLAFKGNNLDELKQSCEQLLLELNAIVQSILNKGQGVDFMVFYEPTSDTILKAWEDSLSLWKTAKPDEPLSKISLKKIANIAAWRVTETWLSAKAACDKLFEEKKDFIVEAILEDIKNYKIRFPNADDQLVEEHVYHCAIDYASWLVQKSSRSNLQINALMYNGSLSRLIKFVDDHAENLGFVANSLIRLKNECKYEHEIEYALAKRSLHVIASSITLSKIFAYDKSKWENLVKDCVHFAVLMFNSGEKNETIAAEIIEIVRKINIEKNIDLDSAFIFFGRFIGGFIADIKCMLKDEVSWDYLKDLAITISIPILKSFIRTCPVSRTERELTQMQFVKTHANNPIMFFNTSETKPDIEQNMAVSLSPAHI